MQAHWSPAWCGCPCHSTLLQEVLHRGRLFWRVPVKTAGMDWNLGEMSQNLQHHVFWGMKWDEHPFLLAIFCCENQNTRVWTHGHIPQCLTATAMARPVIAILASDCGILYNCSSYIPVSYAACRRSHNGGAR